VFGFIGSCTFAKNGLHGESSAQHYGTAIVPARPRAPKDKSKVENAVQQVLSY